MATPATTDLVRCYDDGPNRPDTPSRVEAERAYRESFLATANLAAGWVEPDTIAIEVAWEQRRRVREHAQIECDGIYHYHPGHEVEAARARGRVHAFEFVAQAWDRRDARERNVRAALGPWAANVARWAAKEIDPARIEVPPRPDDGLWVPKMPI
jgi:hypothetical protein